MIQNFLQQFSPAPSIAIKYTHHYYYAILQVQSVCVLSFSVVSNPL